MRAARTVRAALVATMILGALALSGCSVLRGAEPETGFGAAYPVHRDEASGVTAILGTPDLAVGTFRVAVSLNDRTGLIRFPAVAFESRAPGVGASAAPTQRAEGRFHAFPDGIRGLYATEFTFDRAGTWTVTAAVPRPDGTIARVAMPVPVAERASAPVIGASAPKSRNRTAEDVASLAELTTGSAPDPALYRHRIADSIAAHRPLVVIFASPAFCTTPLCGPQVEEASALARKYGDRVDFVHVDLFQHPQSINGDLRGAERSPLLKEWGIRTDEWTFVIDTDGRVSARYEAFVPTAELETAVQRVAIPRG